MGQGYLYQMIHTIGHTPLYVDRHCRLLEGAYLNLCLHPLHLDDKSIAEEICALLTQSCATKEFSIYVELRVMMSGEHHIHIDQISIYEGYTLRCLTPRSQLVDFRSPFGTLPTNARRTAVELANEVAQNLGGDVAVEYQSEVSDGELYSISGCAPFMVVGRTLHTPTAVDSVERELVIDHTRECGFQVMERPIHISELFSADELFYVDHYGITAVRWFDRRSYVDTISSRIADSMAKPF